MVAWHQILSMPPLEHCFGDFHVKNRAFQVIWQSLTESDGTETDQMDWVYPLAAFCVRLDSAFSACEPSEGRQARRLVAFCRTPCNARSFLVPSTGTTQPLHRKNLHPWQRCQGWSWATGQHWNPVLELTTLFLHVHAEVKIRHRCCHYILHLSENSTKTRINGASFLYTYNHLFIYI